jgi:C-terminal processing protease CtpA/Prc
VRAVFRAAGKSGIGITLQPTVPPDPMLPFIVYAINPEGSAFQDGRVRVGDALLAVDGQSVAGMEIEQVVSLVRGDSSKT